LFYSILCCSLFSFFLFIFFFIIFFFFFFQAEDGIRDDLVTGVQTCALPISLALITAVTLFRDRKSSFAQKSPRSLGVECIAFRRSEERRVGKECRSRWSTDQ